MPTHWKAKAVVNALHFRQGWEGSYVLWRASRPCMHNPTAWHPALFHDWQEAMDYATSPHCPCEDWDEGK